MRERHEFNPIVLTDWHSIFKTMTEHERSEILLAISDFPNYQPQGVALWEFFREQLDKQCTKYQEKCETNSRIARERESKKNTGERPTTNVNERANSCTNVNERTPKQEQEQEQEYKQEQKDIYAPSASPSGASECPTDVKKPEGVSADQWKRYKKLRKDKRLPLTLEAFQLIEVEAKKAGKTIPEVITICLEQSWAGFRASWLDKIEKEPEKFDILKFAKENPGLIDDPETIPGWNEK